MSVVLDASALLAALLDEPGCEVVDAVINGARMSTVNLSEVVAHFARLGAEAEQINELLADLPISYVLPDRQTAFDAGLMRVVGDTVGLSLGDRMCLALGRRSGGRVLTADRSWAQVAEQLEIDVQLIR